ncbi:MAG TPA: hypothetical protein VJJ24_00990 [Candidatus Paceibacterota bacterium]
MAKSQERIIDLIRENGQAKVDDIVRKMELSRQIVHRHLAELLESKKIKKVGKSPKVFYILNDGVAPLSDKKFNIDPGTKKVIEDNFLLITPSGERKEGVEGFIEWCRARGEDVSKTAKEYVQSVAKFARYKKGGLIDGSYKMKHTFKDVHLDKIFYLDFYSIERFGKTKLGQLLLYAKQSQNKSLMKELVKIVKPKITGLISRYSTDAVGFIPPTVKREVQLMKELEKDLNLPLPSLNLFKIKTEISVPQKTLSKLNERIENARSTFIVDEKKKYKTVLLIDDALGSGATLNEIAKRLKEQKVAQKVIGLAITGSFSGFEVISEV